jgi:hypothetical protein
MSFPEQNQGVSPPCPANHSGDPAESHFATSNAANCPHCDNPSPRVANCNLVSCPRCAKRFCFVCRDKVSNAITHFDQGSGQGCPILGDQKTGGVPKAHVDAFSGSVNSSNGYDQIPEVERVVPYVAPSYVAPSYVASSYVAPSYDPPTRTLLRDPPLAYSAMGGWNKFSKMPLWTQIFGVVLLIFTVGAASTLIVLTVRDIGLGSLLARATLALPIATIVAVFLSKYVLSLLVGLFAIGLGIPWTMANHSCIDYYGSAGYCYTIRLEMILVWICTRRGKLADGRLFT